MSDTRSLRRAGGLVLALTAAGVFATAPAAPGADDQAEVLLQTAIHKETVDGEHPAPIESLLALLDPVREALRLLAALLPTVAGAQAAALVAVGVFVAVCGALSTSPGQLDRRSSRIPREAAHVCPAEPTDGQPAGPRPARAVRGAGAPERARHPPGERAPGGATHRGE